MVEQIAPRCSGFLKRFGFELFNKNGAARPSVRVAAGSIKNALTWAGVDKAAGFFDAHSAPLRTTADHLMHTHSLPLQVTGLALKAAVIVPVNCGIF